MQMEVDVPNHQSTWLINQAKTADSIYEARSWLLTAKNAAPALFSVQFAAYELELKEWIFWSILSLKRTSFNSS